MNEEERTIVFADLSGFTALTEAHGDEAGAAIALRFFDMARSVLTAEAKLVKTIGDAVMLVVPDPCSAVRIVLALQALADSTPDFPVLRAGLHAGPALETGNDFFGNAVNLAARVAAWARPGQILCTTPIAERAAADGLCTTAPLGPVRLHNIHDKVALWELHPAAARAAAVDPICRMHVDGEGAARVRIDDREYVFCSADCLRLFLSELSNEPATAAAES